MSAVELSGIARRFDSSTVLSRLDLVVDPGEHVVITGANGAGKTTLLRLIAGLLRPDEGEVRVLGGSPDDPAVRRRIGFVGHTAGLYPRMTAAENLRFWARMYDDPSAAERGRDLLRALGLDPDDRRHIADYSQGMRQRASIAKALSIGPELVVADEPLASLDADGTKAVGAILDEQPTIVLATHQGSGSSIREVRRLELAGGRLR